MEIVPILVYALVAFFPAALWLTFFLREDDHAEPISLLTKTFLLGAAMSVPALLVQMFFERMIGDRTAVMFLSMFLFAGVEELAKFLGAYSAVLGRPEFDEPIDGMIYLIVAGLGFATVENVFVLSSFYNATSLVEMLGAGQALILRLIGATLLHTLASALAGYYWAHGIVAGESKRFIVVGLVVATLVHGIFNYLIYIWQFSNLLLPSLFLVGITFFVLSDFEKIKREGGREV